MPKARRVFSGREVIKILTKNFGFFIVSQKGSHVKLCKNTKRGMITTIIPLHKELATGTLNSILKLAQIERKEFILKALI